MRSRHVRHIEQPDYEPSSAELVSAVPPSAGVKRVKQGPARLICLGRRNLHECDGRHTVGSEHQEMMHFCPKADRRVGRGQGADGERSADGGVRRDGVLGESMQVEKARQVSIAGASVWGGHLSCASLFRGEFGACCYPRWWGSL